MYELGKESRKQQLAWLKNLYRSSNAYIFHDSYLFA